MITTERDFIDVRPETTASGVSWTAILAGASAAAALSLILLLLGVGLGFSAISPWSNNGASPTAIGVSSIIWLAFTQIVASGLGGYLAGRLRIKWATVHTDEVYFRDTAHGFLAWAIASLAAAALLGSVVGNVISTGISAGATVASAAVGTASVAGVEAATNRPSSDSIGNGNANDGMLGYAIDSVFRTTQLSSDASGNIDTATKLEAGRIFANGLRANGLPPEDHQYLTQVVVKRTGLSPAEADKRVTDIFNKTQTAIASAKQSAKQIAESVRKAAAYSALWMFITLLSGAFVASLFATFGGRQRDRVIHTGGNSV